MSGGRVDKELTESILDAGELSFGPREAERLGLPAHSGPVEVLMEGAPLVAYWNARARSLGGEGLRDELQLCGRVGEIARVETDAGGGTVAIRIVSPAESFLRFQVLSPPAPASAGSGAGPATSATTRRRSAELRERLRVRARDEFDWLTPNVGIARVSLDRLRDSIAKAGFDDIEDLRLRIEAERLGAVSGFDELLALGLVRIDHMPHQEAAALRVLRDLQGRAVLADEVGLGKTIEAGLIMKELILRGLARRVLIVCPAPLRDQWKEELHDKFEETFRVVQRAAEGFDGDLLITSLHMATRNRDRLLRQPWDLVIIDEAHKIAGANSKAGRDLAQRAADLDSGARYVLFLSATPVQNELGELYRIVQVLRPGTFDSERSFRRQYVSRADPRRPVDPEGLRRLCSEVMVRTTRAQAGLDKVRRHPRDVAITLSAVERKLYEVAVGALRDLMGKKGDHLRRLQLARRLVGSPRALSDTALRMAGRSEGDPRLGEVLRELGHLAAEVGTSSRQKRLVTLCREWIDDPTKGKVLVFTIHTATLEDIIRALDDAGIEAVPFHGQMSASARSASVHRFRGPAPVMVSTDAGAEGLNLQFANCVVNYDLPWNPMRIEQRIGRVHRVTQTRDVHVANFYAKGTIDERVYAILRDKLAMFELLFGQITTILGEVGDDSGSFESTVLDALTESTDRRMEERLAEFGEQLAGAKERADRMVADPGGVSGWLGDLDHREGLTYEGARELMPAARTDRTERRAEVASFVRRVLLRAGAEVVEEDPEYLWVRLPEALAAEMEREELHLAFTPEARERHADAELCAVGAEVFMELVATLAESGDLCAQLPTAPNPPMEEWVDHDPALARETRVVVGPIGWGARATWLVRTDGVGGGSRLITTECGVVDPPEGAAPLADGSALPESLPTPALMLERVVEAARPSLGAIADAHASAIQERHAVEVTRVVSSLKRQIAERPADVESLRALRDRYRASRAPAGEVRSDLLALELAAHPPFLLRETWRRPDGVSATVELAWHPERGAPDYLTALGVGIDRLGVCSAGHAHDTSTSSHCSCCDRDLCPECGPGANLTPCDLCGEPTCGLCLRPEGAARRATSCPACAQPTRQVERDQGHRVAWGIRGGRVVLVGAAAAEFVDPDGRRRTVARDARRAESRRHSAALARAHGLPEDAGVAFEPAPVPADDAALRVRDAADVDWRVEHRPRAVVDRAAAESLAEAGAPPLAAPTGPEKRLLDRLAREVPPPVPPTLVAYERVARTRLLLGGDGLVEERVVFCAVEAEAPQELDRAPFRRADEDGFVALAVLDGVEAEAERLHDAYVVRIHGEGVDAERFVPSPAARSRSGEEFLATVAREAGVDPLAVVLLAEDSEPLGPPPRPRAGDARLVARTSRPTLAPSESTGGRVPGDDDLAGLGFTGGVDCAEPIPPDAADDLWLTLRLLDDERPEVAHDVRHRVREHWLGSGCAIRRFTTPGTSGLLPVLADTGAPAEDFSVCSSGHLHEPDSAQPCPACDRSHCPACGDDLVRLVPCETCGRDACGLCRSLEPPTADWTRCAVCGDGACAGCGRDRTVAACALCHRAACEGCLSDGVCADCQRFSGVDWGVAAGLPEPVRTTGARVRSIEVGSERWSLLTGPSRRELVCQEGDRLTAWARFDERSDEEVEVQLALAGDPHLADGAPVRLQRPDRILQETDERASVIVDGFAVTTPDRRLTVLAAEGPSAWPAALASAVAVSAGSRPEARSTGPTVDRLFGDPPSPLPAVPVVFEPVRFTAIPAGQGIRLDAAAPEGYGASLCSLGHLRYPAAVAGCPSCGRERCSRCPQEVAIDTCSTCRRPACGECRAGAPGDGGSRDSVTECALCGEGSCRDCARNRATSPCWLCRRTACSGCATDGVCADCRALVDRATPLVGLAPATLGATGARVFSAVRAGLTWFAIAGHGRRELAVLRGDDLVRWVRFDDRDDDLAAIQLAIARLRGRSAPVAVARSVEPGAAPGPDRHVLWTRSTLHVTLDDLLSVSLIGPGATVDPVPTLRRVLDDGRPHPQSARGADVGPWRDLFAEGAAGAPVAIAIDQRDIEVTLTASGLMVRTNGPTRAAYPAAFRPASSDRSPADPAGWSPVPRHVATATCAAVRAEALVVGDLVALRVLAGRLEPRHFRLDAPAEALDRAAIAQAMGLGPDVELHVVETPREDQIQLPALAGAWTRTIRSIERVPQVAEGSDHPQSVAIVREAMGASGALTPALDDVSSSADPIAAIRRLIPARVRQTVGLATRVSETYMHPEWGTRVVDYVVGPGEMSAHLTTHDGRRVSAATLDREGHITDAPVCCRYCEADTCARCESAALACVMCGIVACRGCRHATGASDSEPLCPACAALRKGGLLTRRIAGLRGRPLLRGEDRVHAVQYARDGEGQWRCAVSDADGERLGGILPAAARGRLDALTGS